MGYPDMKALQIKPDSMTALHIEKTLGMVPKFFHSPIIKAYNDKIEEYHREREANLFMLGVQEYVPEVLMLDKEEIKRLAKRLSLQNKKNMEQAFCEATLFLFTAYKPFLELGCFPFLLDGIQKKIKEYAYIIGVNFALSHHLSAPKGSTKQGREKRLSCKIWWCNQLEASKKREFEELSRVLGILGRDQMYVTNLGHAFQKQKEENTRENLASKEIVCEETGEKLDLLEFLDGSLANPANKFSELYGVAKGFEAYAKKNDHKGVMLTITLPGFQHANSEKFGFEFEDQSGEENGAKKIQTRVREGQAQLSNGWNRCTTAFKYIGVYPYGQRVVESHLDGTVHWHVGIFLPKDKISEVTDIVKNEFLSKVTPDEKGAKKHRVTAVEEDHKKGAFSSYMFKYLSKTLEAYGVGADDEAPDEDAKNTMPRAKSWASIHGIRRVQMVGGASIGVWRELRRCKDKLSGVLEDARICANSNDWVGYFELQGGHEEPQRKHKIQRLSSEKVDKDTGEIKTNRYGEKIKYTKGIKSGDLRVITRTKTWVIKDKATGETESDDFLSTTIGIDLLEVNPENTIDYPFFYDDPDLNLPNPFLRIGGQSCDPWTINSNSRE